MCDIQAQTAYGRFLSLLSALFSLSFFLTVGILVFCTDCRLLPNIQRANFNSSLSLFTIEIINYLYTWQVLDNIAYNWIERITSLLTLCDIFTRDREKRAYFSIHFHRVGIYSKLHGPPDTHSACLAAAAYTEWNIQYTRRISAMRTRHSLSSLRIELTIE